MRGAGPIGELREHFRGRYRLAWRGTGTAFLDGLRAAGVAIDDSGTDSANVGTPPAWQVRQFYEISARCQVTLRDVVPAEEDLEDLYHRVIETV